MPCYSPLDGWYSRVKNPTGKRSIVFDIKEGLLDRPVTVPCGQCLGCRLERSRQWAVRCVHEASLYEKNCFLTLTYSPENLPANGTLVLEHFQNFMKRYRKKFGNGIRFFHVGEYGEKFKRPHYHAIIFNHDLPDKELLTQKGGVSLYTSKLLEELWPNGFSTVGEVTFESCAYVARYCLKKINGDKKEDHYRVYNDYGEEFQLKPEYTTMSRRPGIAAGWYEKFKSDVYPKDFITSRGFPAKPPRFYDKQLEHDDPALMRKLKLRRVKKALTKNEKTFNNRTSRLVVLGEKKRLDTRKLIRSYEND